VIQGRELSPDRIIVGLADEGIPVAAIARAIKKPSDDVRLILQEALDTGQIIKMPAAEWPHKADGRTPTTERARAYDIDEKAKRLAIAFELHQQPARLLATLMLRGFATSEMLLTTIAPESQSDNLIRVYMVTIRRALAKFAIEIKTHYGVGISISEANRQKINQLIESMEGIEA